MTKIAIIGSRKGFNRDLVLSILSNDINLIYDSLISGGASGVDSYANDFAKLNGIPIEIIKPINPTDKISYLFRNIEILTKADLIIAFWDGQSKGTKFVIDYAKARNKGIIVYNTKGEISNN